MPYNEKFRDYSLKYAKEKLKRVPLDLTKERYEEVKAAAERQGSSVNGYIKDAITEKMSRDSDSKGDVV